MATTWTELYTKTRRLSKDNNPDTLVQIKQDLNTGYHLFNAKFGRYYTRKQQFTNLVANQQMYQTPLDCIRVMGMTVMVTDNYQPTVKEIRSEYQWRQIVSWQTASTWPAWYYMLGNDLLSLWPIPSQSVTNGLRFYYQPRDVDLSVDDVTSAANSTGGTVTVTVTNGSPTVTASAGAFSPDMAGLWFQITGTRDNSWYEIVSATTTVLTLKSAFVAPSGAGLTWRVAQLSILPPEYQEAPMHYALGNFFSSVGNEARSQYHLGSEDKPGMYYSLINDAEEEYSSNIQSNVIMADESYLNPWMVPPVPSP